MPAPAGDRCRHRRHRLGPAIDPLRHRFSKGGSKSNFWRSPASSRCIGARPAGHHIGDVGLSSTCSRSRASPGLAGAALKSSSSRAWRRCLHAIAAVVYAAGRPPPLPSPLFLSLPHPDPIALGFADRVAQVSLAWSQVAQLGQALPLGLAKPLLRSAAGLQGKAALHPGAAPRSVIVRPSAASRAKFDPAGNSLGPPHHLGLEVPPCAAGRGLIDQVIRLDRQASGRRCSDGQPDRRHRAPSVMVTRGAAS